MKDLGGTQLFLWETAAAFAFVYLLWPAMWTKPGYGAGGPLLAGVILFGVLATGALGWRARSLLSSAVSCSHGRMSAWLCVAATAAVRDAVNAGCVRMRVRCLHA